MRRFLKLLLVLSVLLLIAAGWFLYRVVPRIPDRPFAKPSGPFAVGTREYDWTDSSRGEPYTRSPADHRRIVVQVWYPAAPGTRGDTARYLRRPAEFSSRAGAWFARKALTNSVVDAPLATTDSAGFPVLLYNHGGAWTRWSATYVTEWLASYGYVVFSIEHFGFNQSVRFPDGTPFAPDTLGFPKETGDGKKDALASWAYLENPVFGIWKADARFALDRIERLARESGPFQGRLDLERIGTFGWSFGGALAIELSAVDPRVKAAVDQDGQLFGEVKERGTARPVLEFHHGVDDALGFPEKQRPAVRELIAMTQRADSVAQSRSTGDWYAVTVAGTDHGDFSDLSLFFRRSKDRADARRAHEIIRAYTLAFFDHYLRGTTEPLLAGGASPYPEATVQVWKAR